jgi:chromodomain-helicase-DNA-binding protein 7
MISYCTFHSVDVADFTDVPVDHLSPAKARQILDRVDLLSKIREEILSHPHLEERLSLCQPSGDTPDWWQPGKHDKELLLGAAKHGLGRTDITILNDPDFSFHKLLTRSMYAGTQTPKTMDKSEKAIKIESREDILKFDKDEILVKLEKGEGTLKIEKVGAKKDKDQSTIDKKPDSADLDKTQVELTIVKAETKSSEEKPSSSLTITTIPRTLDTENIAIKSEEKSELAIEPLKSDNAKTSQTEKSNDDEKITKKGSTENAENLTIIELEKEDIVQEKETTKQEIDSVEKSEESQTQEAETSEKNDTETKDKSENVEKSSENINLIEDENNKTSTKLETVSTKEDVEMQEAKNFDLSKEKPKISQIEDKCSVQAAELKAMFPDLEVIQPLSRLTQIDTFVLRDKSTDYNNEPTVVQLLAHGCGNATSIKWPKVCIKILLKIYLCIFFI